MGGRVASTPTLGTGYPDRRSQPALRSGNLSPTEGRKPGSESWRDARGPREEEVVPRDQGPSCPPTKLSSPGR